MNPYYIIAILVGFGCIFFDGTRSNKSRLEHREFSSIYKLYYICCCLIFIFMLGFRADFSTDYNNYVFIFNSVGQQKWSRILTNSYELRIEIGFCVLSKLIFTINQNTIFFMLVIALLSLCPLFFVIYRYSRMPFVSVFLFYLIGFYFHAFNTIRSCMVAGIASLLVPLLIKNNLKNYFISTIVLLLFHSVVIVFIPLCFVVKVNLLKGWKIIGSILGLFILIYKGNSIIFFVNKYLYDSRYRLEDNAIFQPGPFGAVVPSIAIFCLLLACRKLINVENNYELVIQNGTFMWFVVEIFTLVINIVTRYVDMLCIFPILYLPMMITTVTNQKFKAGRNKVLLCFVVQIACVSVFFLWFCFLMKDFAYNPYRTIWSTKS